MLTLNAPRGTRTCDGVTRRELLRAGGSGVAGLSLPALLKAEANKPAGTRRALFAQVSEGGKHLDAQAATKGLGPHFANALDVVRSPAAQKAFDLEAEPRPIREKYGDHTCGRTPEINTGNGRDHWPFVYSTLLRGGGVKGGTVYGASDKVGAYPARPEDLLATVYHALGIDPDTVLCDALQRPHHLIDGKPIKALLS